MTHGAATPKDDEAEADADDKAEALPREFSASTVSTPATSQSQLPNLP
jgi:hypothetical protein